MATVFKEVVTVNAPGKDIVFDGCDFVGISCINIITAQSVKVTNCRFLDSKTEGITVSGETKLMVSYSYFCDNSMIAASEPLADGSYVSNNYFNGGKGSVTIHALKDDTTVTVSSNIFKNDAATRVSVPGSPSATIKMIGNQFETDYLMSMECNADTESYNNVNVQFVNNIGKNPVILGPHTLGGAPDWSDTDNYPKVSIDGKNQGYTLPLDDSAELIRNLMFQVADANGEYIGVYGSFAEAYENTPAISTITLLNDAELNDTLTIEAGKDIVLDLADWRLNIDKAGARAIFNNGKLTICNGMIDQWNDAAYGVIDNSKNSPATLVLRNLEIDDNGNGDGATIVDRGNGSVTLSECQIYSMNPGAAGNACCTMNNGAKALFENSVFECKSAENGGAGSYSVICRGATIDINNCTVHGSKGAIAVDYGKVNVNGGDIIGDKYYAFWITNDGVSTECHITGNPTVIGELYGVYCSVDDGNQDVGNANVTIDSGTFYGNKKAAAAIGSKNTIREWGMQITGGTFRLSQGGMSDVSAYVPTGYYQNDEGEVIKGTPAVNG